MFEIPEEQLPPGFVDSIITAPDPPVPPRPAATIVLLRDAPAGPEVLLMRRHQGSGFVPGAWVFPGGRVDAADSGPALHERIRGLRSSPVPAAAYWTAALRELFEETGVLLARAAAGDWAPDTTSSRSLATLRHELMDGAISLLDVLEARGLTLDVGGTVYAAHWITPVVERRRYDTHFFAAALPEGRTVTPDPREMTQAVWLEPAVALDRFRDGDLPMVFPTVKTLALLSGYDSVEHVLVALEQRAVRPILPRLVRTERGVGIVVDE
jgi:recombination protein RecT